MRGDINKIARSNWNWLDDVPARGAGVGGVDIAAKPLEQAVNSRHRRPVGS